MGSPFPRMSGGALGKALPWTAVAFFICLGCTRPEPGELPQSGPKPHPETKESSSRIELAQAEPPLEEETTGRFLVKAFDEGGNRHPDPKGSGATESAQVASITETGLLQAHAPEKIQIKVDDGQGVSDWNGPEMAPPEIFHIEIRPSVTRLPIGEKQVYHVFATDSGNNELSGLDVKWHSKSPAVARVDSDGTVTGIQSGKARIVATANDRVVSFRLTIIQGSN